MFFVKAPYDTVRLALAAAKVGSEAPRRLGLVPDHHNGTQFFTDDDVVHGPRARLCVLAEP
jgi:hypothetical protein